MLCVRGYFYWLLIWCLYCVQHDLRSPEEMHQHDKSMCQHGEKRHNDDDSIHSEEEKLEGFFGKIVFDQLGKCDGVEKNNPQDVDKEDES